jgi:hypothetical protein
VRTIDTTQTALLAEPSTAPIYLVSLDFGAGLELLSTNGDQVVDAQTYTGADVGVAGMDNWQRASIRLLATQTRAGQVVAGDWRGKNCDIWLLPCVRYPQIIEDGYFAAGYMIQGTTYGEPILLLDGVLTSASIGETIDIGVTHEALIQKICPRTRLAKPILNSLPAPGSQFIWSGETYTLEPR